MANEIQFPTSPTNGNIYTMGGRNYRYDSAQDKFVAVATATIVEGGGVTIYATIDDLPLSGNTQGDLAHVTANNTLYFWNGSGWYKIALINNSPSISNVNSSYTLSDVGADTVITMVAEDPEGLAITYSIASDTSGNTATVVQGSGANSNIFTITPSTDENDNGTFSLTFRASDGVNIATAPASFTLNITTIIPNSKYTTALITSVGSNNADNNDFVDSSTNSHTITASGDVTQSTFSPYRHGGYSTYFDGSGDYLDLTTNAALTIGTADFTAECWIFVESGASLTNYWRSCFSLQGDGNSNAGSISIYMDNGGDGYPAGSPAIISNNNSFRLQSNSDVRGQWTHVAIARESGTLRFFVNGSLADSTSDSTNYNGTNPTRVGVSAVSQSNYWLGYVADARLVIGTAVYTSAFTPPTQRLTAITNTSLLTCHLPYISDGSTNGHSITVNGNTKTAPFAPYDYLTYASGDHGGSMYFDGSGDYLRADTALDASTSAGDPMTVETWFIVPSSATLGSAGSFSAIWGFNAASGGSNVATFGVTSSGFYWHRNTSGITLSNSWGRDQWHHLAVVYHDGTNGTAVYLNGKSIYTNATAHTTAFADCVCGIGAEFDAGNGGTPGNYFPGHLADFRITHSAVYTADFTPPTAPLTEITNTSLLLQGTNAGIIDKSQSVQTLTLHGDVKSSTTQSKYLTSSMYFDGTGDHISTDPIVLTNTEPFTIEMWYYNTSSGTGEEALICQRNPNSPYNGWRIYNNQSATNQLRFYNGTGWVTIESNLAKNQWHHIAVVSQGSGTNQGQCYLNGTVAGSAFTTSSSINYSTNLHIGTDNAVTSRRLTGYLSDIRITKGLARYTANFTPPTEALLG